MRNLDRASVTVASLLFFACGSGNHSDGDIRGDGSVVDAGWDAVPVADARADAIGCEWSTDGSCDAQSQVLDAAEYDSGVPAETDADVQASCMDSSTIVCKTPDLDISQTGGEIRYIDRPAGITHVYTIPPGNRVARYYGATIGLRYVTTPSLPVTISLSEFFDQDSSDSYCTVVVDREEGAQIGYSEHYEYACLLDPAKTYFFRVSGAKTGSYWLVW